LRIAIRALEEQDAHVSVKWRNVPEVWVYTLAAGRSGVGIEDELNWIRRVLKNADERRFAILADDAYVGNVYLTGIDGRAAEYHIVVGEREYWGKGIAREATKLVLAYARNQLRLESVDLIVHPDNKAALKLYNSLGFTTLGRDGPFIRMSIALGNFAPTSEPGPSS
jgi:RimJ/RimL family protein N-acetyltransferase